MSAPHSPSIELVNSPVFFSWTRLVLTINCCDAAPVQACSVTVAPVLPFPESRHFCVPPTLTTPCQPGLAEKPAKLGPGWVWVESTLRGVSSREGERTYSWSTVPSGRLPEASNLGYALFFELGGKRFMMPVEPGTGAVVVGAGVVVDAGALDDGSYCGGLFASLFQSEFGFRWHEISSACVPAAELGQPTQKPAVSD